MYPLQPLGDDDNNVVTSNQIKITNKGLIVFPSITVPLLYQNESVDIWTYSLKKSMLLNVEQPLYGPIMWLIYVDDLAKLVKKFKLISKALWSDHNNLTKMLSVWGWLYAYLTDENNVKFN